jgi:hypothetical protein
LVIVVKKKFCFRYNKVCPFVFWRGDVFI